MTAQTVTQKISTVRASYAALRRLEISGGRTAATTNAIYRHRYTIRTTDLARELSGNLAYEDTLLRNIAASRRNGVERPELTARLAVTRRQIRASA